MSQYVAQVYVSVDGKPSLAVLKHWLSQATVLDFDSESYDQPYGTDGFACTIDWDSLTPQTKES
jgi:hypothetical protein